jgi:hypothetical protein
VSLQCTYGSTLGVCATFLSPLRPHIAPPNPPPLGGTAMQAGLCNAYRLALLVRTAWDRLLALPPTTGL